MRKAFAAVTIALLLIPRWAAGPLAVWGVDPFAHTSTPGDFVALAAGGALQTLAIRADGTLFLSSDGDTTADFIPPVEDQHSPFIAVGMGAITPWPSARTAASLPGESSRSLPL
jgi:hypothetical protein